MLGLDRIEVDGIVIVSLAAVARAALTRSVIADETYMMATERCNFETRCESEIIRVNGGNGDGAER